MNETTLSTMTDIAKNTSNTFLDNSVLGATVLLFGAMAVGLLYLFIKDNRSYKDIATSFERLVTNQESFTKAYSNTQEHHEEIVEMLIDMKKDEKLATQKCYEKLHTSLNDGHRDIKELLTDIQKSIDVK